MIAWVNILAHPYAQETIFNNQALCSLVSPVSLSLLQIRW